MRKELEQSKSFLNKKTFNKFACNNFNAFFLGPRRAHNRVSHASRLTERDISKADVRLELQT